MKNQAEDLVSEIRPVSGQIASWGRSCQSLFDGSICFSGSSLEAFTEIYSINPSLLSAAFAYSWIRPKVAVCHPFALFPVVNKHQFGWKSITSMDGSDRLLVSTDFRDFLT